MSKPTAAAAAPSANTSGVRRSFTVPARLAPSRRPLSAPESSADGIETLFTCSSTKIVSFTAPATGAQASNSQRQAAAGSDLQYRSPTERTLAVGALRIYRVTSSNVSFLNSGHLLHTIFPRSQCWCVDGESTFVLRIRQDSYYRIELPFHTDEDKQKIEELKGVFAQVLQYERTPCPFSRPFSVELPERPKTPPRRKSIRATGKAKKWTFDKTWMPEDGLRPPTPLAESSDTGTMSSYEEEDRSSPITVAGVTAEHSPAPQSRIGLPTPSPQPSVRERAKKFQGSRSVTAPLGLEAGSPRVAQKAPLKPLKSQDAETLDRQGMSESGNAAILEEPEEDAKDVAETQSLISSVESFETARQFNPSPKLIDAEIALTNPWEEELNGMSEQHTDRGRTRHRREISDITVRPKSAGDTVRSSNPTPAGAQEMVTTPTNAVHPSSTPSTPQLVSDSDEDSVDQALSEVCTPPDTIRLRRLTGASQRRAFSPIPNAQNLFRPPSQTPSKQLTTALVRKTCELILGPPAHLVTLMLKIAARISEGAMKFTTYRVRHTGEKLPCSWESSDDEDYEEDDFGIPLRHLDDPASRRRAFSREVD